MKRQSVKEQQGEAKQRAFLEQPLPRDRDAAIAELTKLLGYCSVEFIHACIKFIKLKMVQDSVHRDDLPSA
jgi:hypothetical protein